MKEISNTKCSSHRSAALHHVGLLYFWFNRQTVFFFLSKKHFFFFCADEQTTSSSASIQSSVFAEFTPTHGRTSGGVVVGNDAAHSVYFGRNHNWRSDLCVSPLLYHEHSNAKATQSYLNLVSSNVGLCGIHSGRVGKQQTKKKKIAKEKNKKNSNKSCPITFDQH
jgi:hypothetical protein